MGRSTTTLYLDDDDVAEFKSKNFNVTMSEVARSAIRAVLDEEFDDIATMVRVDSIDKELMKLEKDINTLNNQLQIRIYTKEKLLASRNTVLENMEIIRTANQLAELTKVLNKNIIDCKFNVEQITLEYPKILSQIEKLNSDFNIHSHINRLKLLLDF